jgi:uncharacterized OsmC-like protein
MLARRWCGFKTAQPKLPPVSVKWPRKKNEVAMDLRSLQKPLKDQYRNDPNASQITIQAKGGQTDVPVACSVDIGRAIYHAEAHKGVGGGGTGACSGDLLLGALAACAQITCQMVAAAMGIPTERIEVTVEGDLDLRGTLGISALCRNLDNSSINGGFRGGEFSVRSAG